MRVTSLVIAVLIHNVSAAFAGQPMAPSDIKAKFFNVSRLALPRLPASNSR
jgi:hypothetical protein